MPVARFQMPDGRVARFEVPEGTTPERATTMMQAHFSPESQQTPADVAWSDVPMQAIKNTPQSAANFARGIYQAVRHPIDTAGNLLDAGAGALKNVTPKPIADFVDKFDPNPQSAERAVNTADAVGSMYKGRYGSMEGLKNTLATDPVGVAADLSTVLAGGAALTGGKVSNALATASKYTNPMTAATPVVRGAAKVGGVVGKHILGLATGVGAENVSQAFKSGLGNKTEFMDNLAGRSDMTDVLATAKQNIQNMGAAKSAEYRTGIASVKGDKSVLGFSGIDKAVQDATGAVTFKGQVKNAKGAQIAQEIADEVNKWKALDPADFHTPEGLDALKQKIGGIVEGIPFEEKTARMAASNIYNAIKGEIAAQAPTYAKTMKDYSDAADQIKEIERALSLGHKTSADTAMRKLQSLSRNNVNTNYGNRLDLAKALEASGGNDILPAISGQAMNSWASRGLTGQAGGLATLGASMSNPLMLGLLPLQSPKAVGATLYGAGRLAGIAKDTAGAYGKFSPDQINKLALILNQAGKQPQGQRD